MTQNSQTERAFSNRYWDKFGRYLCVGVATGEPLFSSKDKFESGWLASFTLSVQMLRPMEDKSYNMV